MRKFLLFTFIGSVFLTSDFFVDEKNDIKKYFTLLCILIGLIILMSRKNTYKKEIHKLTSLSTLKGFYIVGFMQACYGVLQYLFYSNSIDYSINGSFDNPAGFVSVIILIYPIGVYWFINSKGNKKLLLLLSICLILFSVIISKSRTGLVALFISSATVFFVEYKSFLFKIRRIKTTYIAFIILLSFLLLGLYKYRTTSANGRILIWIVSLEMIKDKPLFGFGVNGFNANYMNYQAHYFVEHPKSTFSNLADNVKTPYNIFLKVAIDFGILGLILFIILFHFIIKDIFHKKNILQSIELGFWGGFMTLSFLSYPMQYVAVWIILGVHISMVFIDRMVIKEIPLFIRFTVSIFCILGVVTLVQKVILEATWKNLAIESIEGNTEHILPLYKDIYPKLKNNVLFLYNYGAELNISGAYELSTSILNVCKKRFNDFDLQMLLADNYTKTGDTVMALKTYEHAACMIPCRFLPLYYQFELYKQSGNYIKAKRMASIIIHKKIKIESMLVSGIKHQANFFLISTNNQPSWPNHAKWALK